MFSDTWDVDGVTNSIRRSKRGLESRGHEVIVFTASPDDRHGWINGVYYFKGTSFPFYPSYRLCFKPEDISKELKDVDVIHVHTPAFIGVKGMLASFRLKIPSVYTWHMDPLIGMELYIPFLPQSILNRLGVIYMNRFLRSFKALIFPSKNARVDASWLKTKAMTRVFPTGIDLDTFKVTDSSCLPIRMSDAMNDGKKIILTVGRIAKEKNMELIFNTMSQLGKDYILFVVGKGPCYKEYKKRYSSKNVIFLGSMSHPDSGKSWDLPLVYASADCFVLASKAETQGMVVHESMAMGVPVAVLNRGPLPEFVNDRCGRVFEDDPSSLSKAVKDIILNREELSRGAIEVSRQNSLDVFVDRLEGIYKEIQ